MTPWNFIFLFKSVFSNSRFFELRILCIYGIDEFLSQFFSYFLRSIPCLVFFFEKILFILEFSLLIYFIMLLSCNITLFLWSCPCNTILWSCSYSITLLLRSCPCIIIMYFIRIFQAMRLYGATISVLAHRGLETKLIWRKCYIILSKLGNTGLCTWCDTICDTVTGWDARSSRSPVLPTSPCYYDPVLTTLH